MSEEAKKEEKIVNYVKENWLLFVVLAFAIIVRLYYFFKVGEQPIWWDEGDYLALAKIWALDLVKPDWYEHFVGLRPLLYPFVLTAFFKIGLGEMAIRFFTLLLPALGAVYLTYLLGKSMYNQYVGFAAALMTSAFWTLLFYTYRILTDLPSVFLGILSVYVFWDRYIVKNKPSGLYWAMFFGVLAFSTRFPMALIPITFAVFMLFVNKMKTFRDKTVWKGFWLTLLFLLPYLIYFAYNKFYALKFYLVSGATVSQPIDWAVIKFFISLPFSWWELSFILGIISMYPLIIGADVLWKQKTTRFNADFFLVLFLAIHLIFYVAIIREATDRWLLVMMPIMFIISGKGFHWLYSLIAKHSKIVGIVVVGIILFGGLYQNLTHADNLIKVKKDSYREIKLAGEWLKENTPPETKIITSSVVQSEYYSERWNEGHSNKNHRMPPETKCIDNLGGTSANESCQRLSEELFEKSREEFNPDYFIVSVFEPVFTPQWVYTYGQRKNLTLVQFYTAKDNPQQPMLAIYKF